MTGPSARVDPARFAVRGDLADAALADRIFAPHYAEAVAMRATRAVTIRATAAEDGEARADLAAGDPFHMLDASGGWAWGHGNAPASVGYVPEGALAPA